MSISSRCFVCFTCGLGPKIISWVMHKVKYDTWSISFQMINGIACSMAFVLTAMGILAYVSVVRDKTRAVGPHFPTYS